MFLREAEAQAELEGRVSTGVVAISPDVAKSRLEERFPRDEYLRDLEAARRVDVDTGQAFIAALIERRARIEAYYASLHYSDQDMLYPSCHSRLVREAKELGFIRT